MYTNNELISVTKFLEEMTEPVSKGYIEDNLHMDRGRGKSIIDKLTYLDARLFETDDGRVALNSRIPWSVDAILEAYRATNQRPQTEKRMYYRDVHLHVAIDGI